MMRRGAYEVRPRGRAMVERVTGEAGATVSVEEMLSRTPYLIADGPGGVARFESAASRSLATHERARAAATEIASTAVKLLGPYESAMRADLVSESNRLEGLDVSQQEVFELTRVRSDLLEIEFHHFIEAVRQDPRLMNALGLYRAYAIADDWAHEGHRPHGADLRALHGLVMPSLASAGQYKMAANEIQGSEHTPVAPWNVVPDMQELTSWFQTGTGDPVLDAAVVHAWLTHIHPFDDGNGRLARLLANVSLVQAGFPPLLLRSTADRRPYLEALAASDGGDILPLYDLFTRSLRRLVLQMEKPGFVDRKIRLQLFDTESKRYRIWREELENLYNCLRVKLVETDCSISAMGYPSEEDFAALEQLNADGNTPFAKVRRKGKPVFLLWCGYRTPRLRKLRGAGGHGRPWPSIFFAEFDNDPRRVQPWKNDWKSDGSRIPSEVSVSPATQKQVAVRRGATVEHYDIVDAAQVLVKDLVRS